MLPFLQNRIRGRGEREKTRKADNLLTLKRLWGWGVNLTPHPCGFSKYVSSREI